MIRVTRRDFLIAGFVAATLCARRMRASTGPKHPKPRPNIDASKIVANADLKNADAAPAFNDARAIPQILDGIRCHCGCADWEGKYSLLSCYEGDAMAQHCEICQGQARLARRLFRMRRNLDQIRTAIDAKYDS
jgi:hypothetical protein